MKVFITGATGFVGRHVMEEVHAAGHDILASTLKKDKIENSPGDIQWLYGDLADLEYLKPAIQSFNPEVVIHLAWQGIPDYSEAISTINLHNSIQLFDFILEEKNCQKVIVSGSCFEYGRKRGVCNESDHVTINSFFSWAKHSLYQYLSLKCAQKEVDLIWFRIFYVYGPGQRAGSLIPTLVQSFQKGEPTNILNPYNSNDYIFVDDVVAAFGLAVEKDVESGIYNLGSGTTTNALEVCRIVEKEICGLEKYTVRIKGQTTEETKVNFWANIAKAEKSFNWKPHYTLTTGIQQYLAALENG